MITPDPPRDPEDPLSDDALEVPDAELPLAAAESLLPQAAREDITIAAARIDAITLFFIHFLLFFFHISINRSAFDCA